MSCIISRTATVIVALLACLIVVGCQGTSQDEQSPQADVAPAGIVVTADIQAGLEKYIDQRTQQGGGYFQLSTERGEFSLKLVRVHTEYLANLGPRRHFACVDLVDTLGDVYDVDFFLAGDPGSMSITETTLHKKNGQPFYAWQQEPDDTWIRVSVENVSPRLLGIINGRDEFEFLYCATLPEITDQAKMWLPLAVSDSFQTIDIKAIDAPGKHRVLSEAEHGNKVLYLELSPADSGKHIEIRYQVRRLEKSAYVPKKHDPAKFLQPERLVPLDETFNSLALDVVKDKKGDLVRARAIYDHVIDRMRYMKYGDGWGKGDAVYACNAKTGNCTDFHAYFISLARAAGIPARFAIGAAIPSARDEGGIDGYHCWVEFFAEGKWWPVDISEADKYSSLSTYYFGHHPANRIELSRGRDLQVQPGPAAGPINFLAYPVLEIADKPAQAQVKFSFKRTNSTDSKDISHN